MPKTTYWVVLILSVILSLCAYFAACGGGGDDDDDDDDDTSPDTDDDTAADDDTIADDDVSDDDAGDDDYTSPGCDQPSGMAVTLCTLEYEDTLPFASEINGWHFYFSVNFDGVIEAGYKLILDTRPLWNYYPNLDISQYYLGAEQGVIDTNFSIAYSQVGIKGGQSYTFKMYIIDSSETAVSNKLDVVLDLGAYEAPSK